MMGFGGAFWFWDTRSERGGSGVLGEFSFAFRGRGLVRLVSDSLAAVSRALGGCCVLVDWFAGSAVLSCYSNRAVPSSLIAIDFKSHH